MPLRCEFLGFRPIGEAAENLDNFMELIELAVSAKQGLEGIKFSHYTAQREDIDRRIIIGLF